MGVTHFRCVGTQNQEKVWVLAAHSRKTWVHGVQGCVSTQQQVQPRIDMDAHWAVKDDTGGWGVTKDRV